MYTTSVENRCRCSELADKEQQRDT